MGDPLTLPEMLALVERLRPPETVVSRIEADPLAMACIRLAYPRAGAPAPPLALAAGIPIVLGTDLPLGGWRAVNGAGDTVREGSVFAAADAGSPAASPCKGQDPTLSADGSRPTGEPENGAQRREAGGSRPDDLGGDDG